jgi:hypothetical protein
VLFGNFGKQSGALDQQILSAGTWYDYFTGQEYQIESFSEFSFPLSSGEFRLLVSEPIENYISADDLPGLILAEKSSQLPNKAIIYPNPGNNYVKVASRSTIKKIELMDLNGRIIQVSQDRIGEFEARIDITGVPAGMLILNLYTNQGKSSHKILKR